MFLLRIDDDVGPVALRSVTDWCSLSNNGASGEHNIVDGDGKTCGADRTPRNSRAEQLVR